MTDKGAREGVGPGVPVGDAFFRQTRSGFFYRGMDAAEWRYIQKHGHIKSSVRWCMSGEGTCFAPDIETAESYVDFGRTDPRKTGRSNYLVEVRPNALLKYDPRDGYTKTLGDDVEVPAALITRVWKLVGEGGEIVAYPVLQPNPVPTSAVAYEHYVTRVADILVDRFNLHPDDAVELIDMNKRDVARWFGALTPSAVAHRLAVRLRAMMVANPRMNPWWIAAGAAGAIGAVYLVQKWLNAQVQSKIKGNLPPGVTIQPTGLSTVTVGPNARLSINLAVSAASDPTRGQLRQSVTLLFSGATLELTPPSGIVSVTPTSTGAVVTAVGAGSAELTLNFGDPTGRTDAILGFGVY